MNNKKRPFIKQDAFLKLYLYVSIYCKSLNTVLVFNKLNKVYIKGTYMSNKVFISIIALIFILPCILSPVLFILDKTDVIDLRDIGDKKGPQNVYDDSLPSSLILNNIEEFKVEVDNIYTNYLPLYGFIVRSYTSVQITVDNAFSEFLELFQPDSNVDILKATDNEITNTIEATIESVKPYEPVYKTSFIDADNLHRFYLLELQLENGKWESCMESAIIKSQSELSADMETQLDHINRIVGLNDSVNYYLFIESRFQDTEAFGEIFSNETSTKALRDNFLSKIDKKIKHDYFNVEILEDRLKRLYKTDPHWTADGMYDGYTQVINMINSQSPEIGKPREKGEYHYFKDNVWYGANSRRILYYGINDVLSVYDYKLPAHNQKNREKAKSFDEMLTIYDAGDFDKRKSVDHYETFFPRPLSISYPDNNTGHNLLIIGDSYMWAGAELIASHFDNTYVYYPWYRENLIFNNFIKDKGITDVLIMQFSDRLMFNLYGDCPLEYIK